MNPTKAFVAAIFLLMTSMASSAQTRYQHAVIWLNTASRELVVSIDGADHQYSTYSKEDRQSFADANPGLAEVRKMVDDGWENFDNTYVTAGSGHVFVFYMRRPRKEN